MAKGKKPAEGWLLVRFEALKGARTVVEALAAQKKQGLRRRRQAIRKLIAGGFLSLTPTPSQGGSSGGNRVERAVKRTSR